MHIVGVIAILYNFLRWHLMTRTSDSWQQTTSWLSFRKTPLNWMMIVKERSGVVDQMQTLYKLRSLEVGFLWYRICISSQTRGLSYMCISIPKGIDILNYFFEQVYLTINQLMHSSVEAISKVYRANFFFKFIISYFNIYLYCNNFWKQKMKSSALQHVYV